MYFKIIQISACQVPFWIYGSSHLGWVVLLTSQGRHVTLIFSAPIELGEKRQDLGFAHHFAPGNLWLVVIPNIGIIILNNAVDIMLFVLDFSLRVLFDPVAQLHRLLFLLDWSTFLLQYDQRRRIVGQYFTSWVVSAYLSGLVEVFVNWTWY